ncbi:hypothetical protein K8I28_14775 [bacterium]|nr:hypothetical protein [bacterium]
MDRYFITILIMMLIGISVSLGNTYESSEKLLVSDSIKSTDYPVLFQALRDQGITSTTQSNFELIRSTAEGDVSFSFIPLGDDMIVESLVPESHQGKFNKEMNRLFEKSLENSNYAKNVYLPSSLPLDPCKLLSVKNTSIQNDISIEEMVSLINALFEIEIIDDRISLEATQLLLQKSDARTLDISSLQSITRNLQPDTKPFRVYLADWIQKCPKADKNNEAPRTYTHDLNMYYHPVYSKYYFDPNQLNSILDLSHSSLQHISRKGQSNPDLHPLDDENPPPFLISILPIQDSDKFHDYMIPGHSLHDRDMALLSPVQEEGSGNRGNADYLYNTSLKKGSSAAIYRGKFGKFIQETSVKLGDNTFPVLRHPGFYVFDHAEETDITSLLPRRQIGSIVVLPDIGQTNFLASLDQTILDVNWCAKIPIHHSMVTINGEFRSVETIQDFSAGYLNLIEDIIKKRRSKLTISHIISDRTLYPHFDPDEPIIDVTFGGKDKMGAILGDRNQIEIDYLFESDKIIRASLEQIENRTLSRREPVYELFIETTFDSHTKTNADWNQLYNKIKLLSNGDNIGDPFIEEYRSRGKTILAYYRYEDTAGQPLQQFIIPPFESHAHDPDSLKWMGWHQVVLTEPESVNQHEKTEEVPPRLLSILAYATTILTLFAL